jgi:hypothetical protein
MRYLVPALGLALLWAGSARAQNATDKALNGTGVSSDAFAGIAFDLVAEIKPSFGKPLPLDQDDKPLEESEYAVTLKAARAVGGFSIKPLVGASVSPNMKDASKDSSKFFAQLGLETEDTLTRAMRDGKNIEGQDTVIGYVRYRFERPYAEFFGTGSDATHKVSAGLDYKNYLAVWCSMGETRATTGCTGKGSVGYVISPSAAQVFSNDPLKRKFAPKLTGQFLFPTASGVDFLAEAQGEIGIFEKPALGEARDRRDHSLQIKGQIEFSRWLREQIEMPKAFSLNIALQWRRNRSNAPGQDYDRLFVMPAFSVTL